MCRPDTGSACRGPFGVGIDHQRRGIRVHRLFVHDHWEGLSAEAKEVLTTVAIQHEKDSVEALRAKRDEDFAALDAAGMQVVTLEGDAKAAYLLAAREKNWERMQDLMAEQPGGTANYDRLIELFYDPAADQ